MVNKKYLRRGASTKLHRIRYFDFCASEGSLNIWENKTLQSSMGSFDMWEKLGNVLCGTFNIWEKLGNVLWPHLTFERKLETVCGRLRCCGLHGYTKCSVSITLKAFFLAVGSGYWTFFFIDFCVELFFSVTEAPQFFLIMRLYFFLRENLPHHNLGYRLGLTKQQVTVSHTYENDCNLNGPKHI